MMPQNKLAVCMPAYNAAESIKASIDSILNQSYSSFDFIITDDCSTDNTAEIIDNFEDSRIILLRNKINKGGAASRNDMIDYCIDNNYCYMAVMDADDIAYEYRLERQIKTLEQDQSIAVCGSSMKIQRTNSIWHAPQTPSEIKVECVFGNPIPTSTATFRVRYLKQFNLKWDTNYVPCADYHLWYLMLFVHNLRARNTGHVDMVYTYSPKGISHGQGREKQEEMDAQVKKLILNKFGIKEPDITIYNFMKVALSRSNQEEQGYSFLKIGKMLISNNNDLVSSDELRSGLESRMANFIGKSHNLSPPLKKELTIAFTFNTGYSHIRQLAKKFKQGTLDRYCPEFSYKLLTLYKKFFSSTH